MHSYHHKPMLLTRDDTKTNKYFLSFLFWVEMTPVIGSLCGGSDNSCGVHRLEQEQNVAKKLVNKSTLQLALVGEGKKNVY